MLICKLDYLIFEGLGLRLTKSAEFKDGKLDEEKLLEISNYPAIPWPLK